MTTSLVACTRPSTLSGALDDKGGLIPYSAATTLKTVATNQDLLTRLTLLGKTDETGNWKAFKPIYDEADQRGGGREASEGTNIHAVVQALAMGADVSTIPEPTRSDGIAVWRELAQMGIEIIASEQFVYCGGLPEHCAGTLDLLGKTPSGKIVVIDVKSVSEAKDAKWSAMKWATQTAIYALGKPYPHTYRRDQWQRPIVDLSRVEEWDFDHIDQDSAIIMQVVRGGAAVTPIPVNLNYGREWARLACRVRAERKRAAEALTIGTEHPIDDQVKGAVMGDNRTLAELVAKLKVTGC